MEHTLISITLASTISRGRTLRSLGLKLVSLANVPIHQAGDKARQITLQALESVGIRWLGVRVKQQEIVMIQGEKVGFLAFCAVHRHCVESSGLRYTPHKYTAKAATSAVGRLRGVSEWSYCGGA